MYKQSFRQRRHELCKHLTEELLSEENLLAKMLDFVKECTFTKTETEVS